MLSCLAIVEMLAETLYRLLNGKWGRLKGVSKVRPMQKIVRTCRKVVESGRGRGLRPLLP
jgi:hypothetical protein